MKFLITLVVSACLMMNAVSQTRVKVETVYGDIYLKLYDDLKPITVANFLGYVNRGDYDKTVFHRSIPGFVLQTGGFTLSPSGSSVLLDSVTTHAGVINEPGISNLRGTLAMAKQAGDSNSATSQWFINLSDNSTNLDSQNGGFTVFGEVEDMTVVDNIITTRVINVGGAFTNLPLKDLSHPDSSGATQGSEVKQQDFVTLDRVSVVPEPSSAMMIMVGMGALVLRKRR